MAPKKKSITEQAEELSDRVRKALKTEVRRRDFRQLDLEKALGRSHGYFSHLFAGRLALTMDGVLEILLAIDADPAEFFASVFGPDEKKIPPATAEDIEATVLRALRRFGYGPKSDKGEKDEGRS